MMRKPPCSGLVVALLALLFMCSSVPWSQCQVIGGSISGQVTDVTGAVIPDATVTATDLATSTELTTKTNATGFYSFPFLKVGTYKLTFNRTGFKTTAIESAVVQVGQNIAEDVVLQVGAVTESVTITGQAPLLRTSESTVSTVVGESMISDLPLSGRRFTDFVLLTPNANADGQFGLTSIGGQQGGADSGYANGNGSNSFTLDGANANSNYFGDARGRTRVPYIFGEQSIQEFQVADNPYNAAYGGAGAGFINAVTKSGTNSWHGDAFYYNRNSGVAMPTTPSTKPMATNARWMCFSNSAPTWPGLSTNAMPGSILITSSSAGFSRSLLSTPATPRSI